MHVELMSCNFSQVAHEVRVCEATKVCICCALFMDADLFLPSAESVQAAAHMQVGLIHIKIQG